ncbi:predicted protein [Lichtheimia corymbifera JMRC:FSU:9682]|uniref:Uncharacterized protein n=1 Tax=Lichtheimia corymbifera JMRC:FSU:9682 TaxID=1263082 RepID=A0A068RXN1_9FUNG|nr:predicted protein [Lichtheimia corymbifera JMRC:FSU:9682]
MDTDEDSDGLDGIAEKAYIFDQRQCEGVGAIGMLGLFSDIDAETLYELMVGSTWRHRIDRIFLSTRAIGTSTNTQGAPTLILPEAAYPG